MVGGFCSSLACVPSTDVVKIDVNFDLLTLPDDYILTNEEVRVERKKHLKKANIQSLFTFVAIIGTTSFLSFYSVYKNNMYVDNVAAIKQTLVAAVAEVNSYKITRYPKIKSYDEKLLRLGTLYLFDKGLSTPNYVEGKENYQGLSGKYFDILTSKEVITDPSLRWDWVTTEKTPIGRWLVRFK
jgi:hypothetical protein